MARVRRLATSAGEHGRPHRLMAVWTARHDNGWQTSVVENPNGTFAAWAAPDGAGGVDYSVLEEAEHGKEAAVDSLRSATGHSRCSPRCSAWSLQTYAVFDRRSNAAARADKPARRIAAAVRVRAHRARLKLAEMIGRREVLR